MTILVANIPQAGYGKKNVLKDISLAIQEHEIVSCIGPNGAGKSTLLNSFVGIVKVPGGSITFDGADLSNASPEDAASAGLTLVPQGNRVFPELTVLENLKIGGYLLKDRSEVGQRIEELLEIFPGMRDHLKKKAGLLSGGEKQQLALARGLMLHPRLLLLDEPSLGLSPRLVTKAFDTIREVNQTFGTTILLVEQKVREVMKISNRVIGLRMGKIVFQGKPNQLLEDETLRNIFLI